MFNERDRHVLDKISENQYEIIKILKSINENIVRYCGGEHELETEKLKQKMIDARFTKNQFDIIQEFVNYKKDEYEKENKCKITKLPCWYCQPICNSREE